MSKHKIIDKICIAATILSLIIAVFFLVRGVFSYEYTLKSLGYEEKLFDTGKVHTIDISMDNWEEFIAGCTDEEYKACNLTIDGEVYKNVGIRGKGNTSLSNVASMDSDRYSFKVEFDQYDKNTNYYGLDKLCLNNIICDNTYMKDYLVYQLMSAFGVDSPLCSYVYLTVNGENWGLYLAVEGVEEAFLQRNYGKNYGELYKPDSENTEQFHGSNDVKLQYIDDEVDSYPNIFDNAKTEVTNADKRRFIQSLKILNSGKSVDSVVDIEEVIRYFVVHNFVCNDDSYTGSMIHNYYLYEKNGKLSMIPWDYNLAFGTFQGKDATSEVNSPIDSPVSSGNMEDRPMVSWIFSDENYLEIYHRYYSEFLEQMDTEKIISETRALISPYVEKDATKFCTYEEYLQGVETLMEFCELRTESILAQLDGTIPSTQEGQKDSQDLVDASQIDLEDMGIMQNMEMPEMLENMKIPEKMDNRHFSEERVQEQTGSKTEYGNYMLLAISVFVLVIGLVIAAKFKGKN